MQSELQREGLEAQNALSAPQLVEQMQMNQSALIEQTNPKSTIKEIVLRMRGMEELPDGTRIKITEPKMNEFGVQNIRFILNSHINQNVILSHLDKHEIKNIMDAISNTLVDTLTLNLKKFGIKTKTDLDEINDSILINVYHALKRAEGQGEKNWLKGTTIEQISNHARMPKQQKEGFFQKFRL